MKIVNKIYSYEIGFLLSLILTFGAYFLVTNHSLTGAVLIAILLGLAFIQLIVQLIFFLHLLEESKPRWNLFIFLTTVSIILVIIIGSIWIINNLNYRHMTPSQMNDSIIQDEGIP